MSWSLNCLLRNLILFFSYIINFLICRRTEFLSRTWWFKMSFKIKYDIWEVPWTVPVKTDLLPRESKSFHKASRLPILSKNHLPMCPVRVEDYGTPYYDESKTKRKYTPGMWSVQRNILHLKRFSWILGNINYIHNYIIILFRSPKHKLEIATFNKRTMRTQELD